jgi:hypothetical protein
MPIHVQYCCKHGMSPLHDLQNRQVTIDEVAHQLVQPVKLSTTGLPSLKSVHD